MGLFDKLFGKEVAKDGLRVEDFTPENLFKAIDQTALQVAAQLDSKELDNGLKDICYKIYSMYCGANKIQPIKYIQDFKTTLDALTIEDWNRKMNEGLKKVMVDSTVVPVKFVGWGEIPSKLLEDKRVEDLDCGEGLWEDLFVAVCSGLEAESLGSSLEKNGMQRSILMQRLMYVLMKG